MKCRSIEARELARRLVQGERITRDMASSDEVWALVRNSAMGVSAAYHAKLIKNGVPAEKRHAWLKRQHERIEAMLGNAPRARRLRLDFCRRRCRLIASDWELPRPLRRFEAGHHRDVPSSPPQGRQAHFPHEFGTRWRPPARAGREQDEAPLCLLRMPY
jgi:hypothetical protein